MEHAEFSLAAFLGTVEILSLQFYDMPPMVAELGLLNLIKVEDNVILRSCDEERGRLSGERDHAGHCSGSKKARETKDTMD